jgi:lambda family phage portal protein
MNISFPIFSKKRKVTELETTRAQTAATIAHTQALEKMNTAKLKTLEAVMKSVSKPHMTLNQDLYGGASTPYSLNIFGANHTTIKRLSRIAEFESSTARAMKGRFVDLVIGPKLSLQAAPVWDEITDSSGKPTSKEKQNELIKKIESRWGLWAKKKKVSHNWRDNYYTLSRKLFGKLLIDGEYFVLLRYSQTRKKNPLTLQMIAPENIQAINSTAVGKNNIVDGIEYDVNGREVAYHIISDIKSSTSTRVPAFGSRSGRTVVIHNTIGDGPRGIGILVGIITELTKLADLQAAELQAAVINALFAVWVETELGGEEKDLFAKQGVNGVGGSTQTTRPFDEADYQAKIDKLNLNDAGLIVSNIGQGQKLHSFDTKRPTANFEAFYQAVKRNLLSAAGMSIAVNDYKFDASFSAARGELLVFWMRIMTFRFDQATDFDSVIYQMWLWGEVDRGVFTMPGWNDDETREAWSNAKFTGPQRPDIDPMKSMNAAKLEIKEGIKTRAQTTAERGGGDYEENVERLTEENKQLAEANEPLVVQDKTTFSHSENKTESKTETVEPGELDDDDNDDNNSGGE